MIKEQIIKSLRKAGISGEIELSLPPNPEMGDLSFACFDLAKKVGKNPTEAAKWLESGIRNQESGILEKAAAVGPYVNFTLKGGAVAKAVLSAIAKQKTKYGQSKIGQGERVMIEYSQPNTHKEFHVGHLRNVVIGSAMVNLYEVSGFKVISANYIGDVGAHVAKCLWGLEKFYAKAEPPSDKAKWLGEIYAQASRYLEHHPEAKKEIEEAQRKLEAGDKKWLALWRKTRQWSLDGFKKIYQELDVAFDHYFYESEVEKEGKKIVSELLKKGIAQKGEGGALIVDLKKFGLDIFLILKSDGSALYATKDLALARRKFQKYKIERSLYVVDTRQSFYFKQLFKTLELWGFKKPMTHVAYDFVRLPEGMMASRAGRVVLYGDLRTEMVNYAAVETRKRHPDWSASKIKSTALALASGAMKFGLLKINPQQVITFNIKEALSFDGYTGPYLHYGLARINSILRKNKAKGIANVSSRQVGRGLTSATPINTDIEKQLLLKLAFFPETISQATVANDPSHLAKYLYELAKAFSDFYENCPVLKAESEELKIARLELVKAVKIVMENGLGILGMPVVEEM